jgi:hypothetical protein
MEKITNIQEFIEKIKTHSVRELALLISVNWKQTSKSGIYFGAVPYLEAMFTMNSVNDNYGMDSGKSIILYFLSNANTWKGEIAKAIKAELKRRVK